MVEPPSCCGHPLCSANICGIPEAGSTNGPTVTLIRDASCWRFGTPHLFWQLMKHLCTLCYQEPQMQVNSECLASMAGITSGHFRVESSSQGRRGGENRMKLQELKNKEHVPSPHPPAPLSKPCGRLAWKTFKNKTKTYNWKLYHV